MAATDTVASGAIRVQELRVIHRGSEVIWTSGDTELITYHYSTDRRKAYMHPVRSTTGDILTALEPEDHVWHRGVWFSWKYLNEVNFWEETPGGTEDGRTELTDLEEISWEAARTRVITRYAYRTPSDVVLLRERRTVEVSTGADAAIVVDWDLDFRAGEQDVVLDRTAITPETWWGGYGGFSFRSTRAWQDVHGLDSEGRRNQELNYQRARWVQITGIGEDGRRSGVAIFDHPENARYPSHWYYGDPQGRLGFAYINPSLLMHEALTMPAGSALRLRYRLLMVDRDAAAADLDEQHRIYSAGSAG